MWWFNDSSDDDDDSDEFGGGYGGGYGGGSGYYDSDEMEWVDDDSVDSETIRCRSPESIKYAKNLQKIEILFKSVATRGKFIIHRGINQQPPAITLDEVGKLSYPLSAEFVKDAITKLASRAPYGKGSQTLTDLNVRKVWQIPIDKVKFDENEWGRFNKQLSEDIIKGLGVFNGSIKLEFYKALIYDQGGFFLPHKDTEKSDRMFGTLVIQLPSTHAGGDLIVEHQGKSATIKMDKTHQCEKFSYCAFYADCTHEVKPVTSGYRVCLVFNILKESESNPATESKSNIIDLNPYTFVDIPHQLITTSPNNLKRKLDEQSTTLTKQTKLDEKDKVVIVVDDDNNNNSSFSSKTDELELAIENELKSIFTSDSNNANNDKVPTKICYLLQHEYTISNLENKSYLKGHDAEVANILESVSKRYPMKLALGVLRIEESGSGNSPSDLELDHQEHLIEDVVTFNGKDLGMSMELKSTIELFPENCLSGVEPDEVDYEGYTGNEGASFSRTYRKTLILIWPKSNNENIKISTMDNKNMNIYVKSLIDKNGGVKADPDYAISLISKAFLFWSENDRGYRLDKSAILMLEALKEIPEQSKGVLTKYIKHYLRNKPSEYLTIMKEYRKYLDTEILKEIDTVAQNNPESMANSSTMIAQLKSEPTLFSDELIIGFALAFSKKVETSWSIDGLAAFAVWEELNNRPDMKPKADAMLNTLKKIRCDCYTSDQNQIMETINKIQANSYEFPLQPFMNSLKEEVLLANIINKAAEWGIQKTKPYIDRVLNQRLSSIQFDLLDKMIAQKDFPTELLLTYSASLIKLITSQSAVPNSTNLLPTALPPQTTTFISQVFRMWMSSTKIELNADLLIKILSKSMTQTHWAIQYTLIAHLAREYNNKTIDWRYLRKPFLELFVAPLKHLLERNNLFIINNFAIATHPTCSNNCIDCNSLNRFLADVTMTSWDMRAAKPRRTHIETHQLKKHYSSLLTWKTIVQGSPHRLSIEKCSFSYLRLHEYEALYQQLVLIYQTLKILPPTDREVQSVLSTPQFKQLEQAQTKRKPITIAEASQMKYAVK